MRPTVQAQWALLAILILAAAAPAFLPLDQATGTTDTKSARPTAATELESLKRHILHLTNVERTRLGLLTVQLGDNPAPQIHAQNALENCYNSHWDRWGLRPYHRLALAGGSGFNLENIIGLNHCVKEDTGYQPLSDMRTEIRESIQAWMLSPGHRDAMLNPAVTTMHVGIAHDSHNMRIVQHFEADYVSYSEKPSISPDGILTLRGNLHGAIIEERNSTFVRIGYEPPPKRLSRGQLARTYAVCIPAEIGSLMAPHPHTSSLNHLEYRTKGPACKNPAKTDPKAPTPASPEESNAIWADGRQEALSALPQPGKARTKVAVTHQTTRTEFSITADISPLLKQYGPGVYSIMLTGRPQHMTDPSILAVQPIFWQTGPEDDNPYSAK